MARALAQAGTPLMVLLPAYIGRYFQDSAKSLDNLTLLFGDDSWGKEAPERALDETMGSMEIKPRASYASAHSENLSEHR
jgi:hypothetical protein